MVTYTFYYLSGQEMILHAIEAENHSDFYDKLAAWERETGFRHHKGSIQRLVLYTYTEVRTKNYQVPDPPADYLVIQRRSPSGDGGHGIRREGHPNVPMAKKKEVEDFGVYTKGRAMKALEDTEDFS